MISQDTLHLNVQRLQEANFTENEDNDATVFLHENVFLKEEKLILSRYDSQEKDVWYLHMTEIGHSFLNLTKE